MADFDRLKAAVYFLLRPFLTKLDYSALYPATVVSQNGDGSLELKPLPTNLDGSSKLPGISRVKIRYGVPGVTAQVANGGRVLVGFEAANPKAPFALVYDQASIINVSIAGGTQPIARQGDSVTVFFPPTIPFTGTYLGAPIVGILTIVNNGVGVITTGAPKALG